MYAEENITLLTKLRAVWIDRANKKVRVEGGRELPYDALVLATGAKPRKLPLVGADLEGVYLFRTAADVDRVRERSFRAQSLSSLARAISGSKLQRLRVNADWTSRLSKPRYGRLRV